MFTEEYFCWFDEETKKSVIIKIDNPRIEIVSPTAGNTYVGEVYQSRTTVSVNYNTVILK